MTKHPLAATAATLALLVIGTPAPSRAEGPADFDFILGNWTIKNRVLDKPLTGSSTWYEFDATSVNRPVWGGTANVEEWDGTSPKGHIQGLAGV